MDNLLYKIQAHNFSHGQRNPIAGRNMRYCAQFNSVPVIREKRQTFINVILTVRDSYNQMRMYLSKEGVKNSVSTENKFS